MQLRSSRGPSSSSPLTRDGIGTDVVSYLAESEMTG
jgi:hypothetical protein